MTFSIKMTLALLLVLDVALVSLGFANEQLGRPSHLFHTRFGLDAEATVPAWYSASKLLASGGLVYVLSIGLGAKSQPHRILQLVATMLLLLSLDEAAGIHEALALALDAHVLPAASTLTSNESGFSAGAVLIGLFGLVIVAFVAKAAVSAMRVCEHGRITFALGFVCLLAGGVLADLAHSHLELVAGSAFVVEEGLELLGSSFMFYGALLALGALPTWEISATGIRYRDAPASLVAPMPPRGTTKAALAGVPNKQPTSIRSAVPLQQ